MGKSYTPKYRIEFLKTNERYKVDPIAWHSRYGRVNEKNLEKWVIGYINSMKIGGVNEHVSKSIGYIPTISHCIIVNQKTNETIAEYIAPLFQVF